MIISQKRAQKTASYLLQVKAIKLNSKNPFHWASGWLSPIYCDNRVVLSHPEIRTFMGNHLAQEIKKNTPTDFVIAGVATGAIGMGMLVAHTLNAPFIYVRPEPKKHGRKNQIEGQLDSGKNVIVIEDLISTGKSSLNAVTALRENGAKVTQMLALFTYGFLQAKENFLQANIELKTLCDYEHLILEALHQKFVSEQEIASLQSWRKDPAVWVP